jgi:hypothetical protein
LGIAKVEDEDEAVQSHETPDSRPAVADGGRDGTRKETAYEGADGARTLEGGLPGSLDNPEARGDGAGNAEVLGELGSGYELAHEEDAVGFHDL